MISDLVLFVMYFVVLIALALPLGKYMTKVFQRENTYLDLLLKPLEKAIYRLTAVNDEVEMNWKQYAANVILFNFAGMTAIFLIMVFQKILPLNPEQLSGVDSWHLAFNTAVSFMTNTNWQAYAGETTMSYFSQMAGMTVQNFLSAATGLSVAVAFMRGLTRKSTDRIGNFWVDLVRSVLWVLLPLSVVMSMVLVQQGVLQNLLPYITIRTLEGANQMLPMGPVASQEAIKMLGTNGGGFFNANSAHPFENPTPLTNFLQMISIFLIPTALVFTFGHMKNERRQGYALLGAMVLLFVGSLAVVYSSELYGNPIIGNMGVSGPTSLEGKEVRLGVAGSALFAAITTAASCGAVNAMHDSLTPLGGLVPMLQIMLGEVVFGGVGAGFYGMMMYVVLTVFIVGLMVGRTPEYLGKKIEAREIKMAMLAVLIPSVVILTGSALASVANEGVSAISNPGPHGLSQILYAFASGAGNNGSAFGGLTVNTPFYNLMLAAAMLLGRFGVIIPVLAIAGSMAEKKMAPPGLGTFSTSGLLFTLLLAGVVIVIGALTFLPALALGPIVEQLLMLQGVSF